MNRTHGREDGDRHGKETDERGGQDQRLDAAEREARDHTDRTGYQPSVNQRRDEPMPASHHDDLSQEAVTRSEEHAHDGDQAQPSPRAPSRRAGRGDRG